MTAPGEVFEVRGLDASRAWGFGIAILWLLPVPMMFGHPWFAGAWTLALLLASGPRYRLRISSEGVELVRLSAWIVPTLRERFRLDARIEIYQSFEADGPEGLCIVPAWGSGGSECFGPIGEERIRGLCAQAASALERARRVLPVGEARAPHFADNPELDEALDEASVSRWAPSGRLRGARVAREARTGGVVLAPGTELELNQDGYLDPRTPDRLVSATLAWPSTIPTVPGTAAQAGARIFFDEDDGRARSVIGAATGPLRIGRFLVDGRASIGWSAEGALTDFTIADELVVAGLRVPPGSRFSPWVSLDRQRPWHVHLPERAPLATQPEVLISSLVLSPDLTRVQSGSVDADVEIDGQRVRGGVMPLPLDASQRVDLRACAKAGLVVRPRGGTG